MANPLEARTVGLVTQMQSNKITTTDTKTNENEKTKEKVETPKDTNSTKYKNVDAEVKARKTCSYVQILGTSKFVCYYK